MDIESAEQNYKSIGDAFYEKFPLPHDYETSDFNEIKDILFYVVNTNGEWLAFDFLDCSNWDNILTVEFEEADRWIKFVWRDLRGLDLSKESDIVYKALFVADIVAYEIQVESIKILKAKGTPVILLKSYFIPAKSANVRYNKEVSASSIKRDKLMNMTVSVKRKGVIETIEVPIINLYTSVILPKLLCGSEASQKILFSTNSKMIRKMISEIFESARGAIDQPQNFYENLGNDARKILEKHLKLLLVKHQIFNPSMIIDDEKDLQLQMLGKLVQASQTILEPITIKSLESATEILNACSHDHGQYIEKTEQPPTKVGGFVQGTESP